MLTQVYNCPITDCTWTHTDNGPQPLDNSATQDDIHAQNMLHGATIEHALRTHYEAHDTEAWVRLVSQLRGELAARNAPLLCVGCLSDRHAAQQAGQELPPQNPAQVFVGGNGVCVQHVSFDGPQIPGRTRGGLILGDGAIPKAGL